VFSPFDPVLSPTRQPLFKPLQTPIDAAARIGSSHHPLAGKPQQPENYYIFRVVAS
jgi:hypothetical protein